MRTKNMVWIPISVIFLLSIIVAVIFTLYIEKYNEHKTIVAVYGGNINGESYYYFINNNFGDVGYHCTDVSVSTCLLQGGLIGSNQKYCEKETNILDTTVGKMQIFDCHN